jgi:uncharacterized protein involved in exopolysaccharide biosynthesis
MRDHETAVQFYNTLLAKMNQSSMATALEHRQQGEQFRVMDAPNLPDSPTFLNHRVFAGGGLASGLTLGLLLAALLEYDLYYVKHQSIGLDLLIMFETIKTIILRRGAQ